MNINWKLVAALLAAGWTYDMIIARINLNRFNRNLARNEDLKDAVRRLMVANRYYASMLDKYNVPMDRFDEIAIRSTFKN